MGADLRGVKKRFASLMECVQPMITSQFVVWLDEKVSEFKVQGCMNFDISLDAPKWIRDYSMSMLVSGGTTPDIREDDFPPPRRGDIHSNISHRKVPVDSAHFRDQGISRISSGDSVRKRGLSSTQEEYDMGEIKRERLQEEEDDDDDDITVISASVIGDTTPRHSINSNSTSTPKYSIVPTHNVQKTTQRSLSSPSLRPVDSSKRPDLHVVDPLSSHSLSISRDISSSEYTSTSLALPLTTQVFTNIRTISTQSSSVIPNRSEPHSLKAIEFSGAQSSHSSDRDQDVNKTDLDMGIDAYEQDDPDVDEFDDPADCKDGIELIETDMPQTLDSRGLPYSPGSSRDRSGSGDGYGDMAGPSTSDDDHLQATFVEHNPGSETITPHAFAFMSKSTRKTYASHLKSYLTFCDGMRIQPVPISVDNLSHYINYLSNRLSKGTIRQYLLVVRLLHQESNVYYPGDCLL